MRNIIISICVVRALDETKYFLHALITLLKVIEIQVIFATLRSGS